MLEICDSIINLSRGSVKGYLMRRGKKKGTGEYRCLCRNYEIYLLFLVGHLLADLVHAVELGEHN